MPTKVYLWIGVAAVLGACSGALALPVQWTVETGGNGHWYDVVDGGAEGAYTWFQARDAAQSLGGHLATIASPAENTFIYELTVDRAVWYPDAEWYVGPWLGGTDSDTEGNWTWVTGEPWSYTNWLSGMPDNNYPGEEDHLIYFGRGGITPTWNDLYGMHAARAFVLEIPEPATLSLLALASLALMRRRRVTLS